MNKQELNRYLVRIAAMHRMAGDSKAMGQRAIAANRLEQQLDRFADYGYRSRESALNAALNIDESFSEDDFIEDFYPLKKGGPIWMLYLVSACAYQMQVLPVYKRGVGIRLFGPRERISNALWLFEQLRADLRAGADKAWADLKDPGNTTKRRFCNAYLSAAAESIQRSHRNQFDRDRLRELSSMLSPSVTGTGLVVTQKAVAAHSYALAQRSCQFSLEGTKASSNSVSGRRAGQTAAAQYATRRVTPGSKALPG